MKILTKRTYLKPARSDGRRIQIDRRCPRDVSKENARIDHRAKSVSQCNYSICATSGQLGLIVPRDRISLETDEGDLTEFDYQDWEKRYPKSRVEGDPE